MKIFSFLLALFVLANCLCEAKKSTKKKTSKTEKNSRGTFNESFLGDAVPLAKEVYNLHVDLPNNYETEKFNLNNNKMRNDTIFLMNKQHNNDMEELKDIMDTRQKIIDNLIKTVQSMKANMQ